MGIENKCETCSAAPFVRCDCVPDYAGIGDQLAQLRSDLARVTAERDDLRARCKFQDQRIERAIRCSDRLVDERDALRALLPTEAEREVLGWMRDSLRSHTDTFARADLTSSVSTALAYLDRLLGGGR